MEPVRPITCPLLVGRDELLELATRRVEEALGRRGQFLLIAGDVGIGKSRLVTAIADVAVERGFGVIAGYLAPQDRDVPAASILDLARNAIRVPAMAELGHDLLALREIAAAAERTRRRMLVADMVAAFTANLQGPSVLVFEDLQWADDLSLGVIADLARATRSDPILVLGTYRADEAAATPSLREWRSRLLTQRLAEEVRLAPLDRPLTALMTTLILDTGLPAPREVVEAVYERTDGIPLHIEELLGAMSAQARADGRAIREASVPATIEDAVLERLGRRSAEARAVAMAGAVIGRCFVPEVLAGVLDRPLASLDDPLQELLDNAILDPADTRGLYDFRHQLLRDAIYRSVPLSERRRLHARAGEFGAGLEGHSEIHASVHYERAGLRDRAYEAARTGAREAAMLSLHREAFELYRRAIDNAPTTLDAARLGELHLAMAQEALALEEVDAAMEHATTAADWYRRAEDPVLAVLAMGTVVTVMRRDAQPIDQRATLIADLLAEVHRHPLDPRSPEALSDLRYYDVYDRLDRGATEAARAALALARQAAAALDDPDTWSAVEALHEVVTFSVDRDASALDRLESIAATAARVNHLTAALAGYRDGSLLAAHAVDYPRALRLIEAGTRYGALVEQTHCASVMTGNLSMVQWHMGEWAAARETAQQALVDRGSARARAMARWTIGMLQVGQGPPGPAPAELLRALADGRRNGSLELVLPPLWGLAEAAVLAGEADAATQHCQDALDGIADRPDGGLLVPFVVTGTRAALDAGRPAAAEAWLAACIDRLDGSAAPARAAIAHARGLLALASGATGSARAWLQEAVDAWGSLGRVWEGTWALVDLAGACLRSTRYTEAARAATEARAVASRLDSRPLADAADRLLRNSRSRLPVDQPWHPLTSREFEVAQLVTEGCTNAAIAAALGIAPKTASSHVEHILAKLGVSRRAEIAAWVSTTDRVAAAPR